MNYKLSPQLRQYRRLRKITQEEAAEEFGISSVYYGKIERGDRLPSGKLLSSICDTLEENGLCPYSCPVGASGPASEKLCMISQFLSDNPELIDTIYKVIVALLPDKKKNPTSY